MKMIAIPATIDRDTFLNFLARLFFLWIILQSALGGVETGWFLLTHIGAPAWIALALVVALVLYRSDYRVDAPLFIAAYALGYWGEWWGTTRDVWTYSNGQMPPDYLPPLWAIGLLTVTHLRQFMIGRGSTRTSADKNLSSALIRVYPLPILQTLKLASLIVLPALGFALSAPHLARVDWSGRLDAHLFAGILLGIALIAYRFDLDEAFQLFVCGMILGGTYEWLGTSIGEWTYITREAPPLWIIPLWGLACVAMVNLSRLLILVVRKTIHHRVTEHTEF